MPKARNAKKATAKRRSKKISRASRAKARKARANSAIRKQNKTIPQESLDNFASHSASSYKEAILQGILNLNSKSAITYWHAATFGRILLSLTKSTKTLGYSFGVEAGKELYKIVSQSKNYYWYEESIPELISFLEKATGDPVSYQFVHNGLRIRLHSKNAPDLGTNIHSFEAGIMSGFVTVASHQPVKMCETACTSNGSDYCEFLSVEEEPKEKEVEMEEAVSRFAEHVAAAIKSMPTQDAGVPLGYHALIMQPLLDSKYIEALNNISSYMGLKVAESLFDDKRPGVSKIRDYLSKSAMLLNLGAPRLKSISKQPNLNMDFVFRPEISKKEYVEMSLAFINGMISKASRPKVSFEMRGKGGSYILSVKEKQ